MKRRKWPMALSLICALFFTALPTAQADIYWESVQLVQGKGWPTKKKMIRNYLTPDCTRMDIGENVLIADFRHMTGYVLNTDDKMFLEMQMKNVGKIPEGLKEEIRVVPTRETRNIAGYNCRKYKVSFMQRDYDQWLSRDVDGYRELKAINDRLSTQIRQNPLFQMGIVGKMDKLDGFPVQTVMRFSDGRVKTITLRRVSKKHLDPSVFNVPPGYKPPY
ncbi:DUF4412 domain-containing protein [Desulfonema ishimotonii]|uniref:DUF4412 domain-containing protein n=1 Tax=Desulfonema ishimotonii TaxID=45657 RepID=A0A401G152_9BACT|nr:DUF4412 domain-containing protein [Desulfonema ishimotonii]GBC62936.1 DUF4412 domain-containing protein [Desulfonema ishimotonii]